MVKARRGSDSRRRLRHAGLVYRSCPGFPSPRDRFESGVPLMLFRDVSLAVRHLLAKEDHAGSNPARRSVGPDAIGVSSNMSKVSRQSQGLPAVPDVPAVGEVRSSLSGLKQAMDAVNRSVHLFAKAVKTLSREELSSMGDSFLT